MIYQGTAQYPVREIILHTSATDGDWWRGKTVWEMRDAIDLWHKDRGFRKIGYHFVVAPDGSVAKGRSETEIGAHVKEHNRGTIGICMVPVKEITRMGEFEFFYTPEQKASVRAIINGLADRTIITRISGHNEYANKLCPGFIVNQDNWLQRQGMWDRFIAWLKRKF